MLEGLEPVRRRPGMYIGGTDERALHHLAAEVLDNAMDEAVAGHANRIEVVLEEGNRLTITDNGRGIPVDEHPKFPGKSALEVILSTLHSGGKFSGKAYATSGGLHGVGVSVVNALSSDTRVEVARDKQLYRAGILARACALGPLQKLGATPNRRGTTVSFMPDTEIFGDQQVQAAAPVQARPLEGLSVRRRRNPLEMRCRRSPATMCRRGGVPVPRRAGRSSCRTGRQPRMRHQPVLCRQPGLSGR